MNIDMSPDEARERLEDAGASFEETEKGWRARLGGGVAEPSGDGGVTLLGNTERLDRVLTDAEGTVVVEFDGAARGTPGPAAAAYILRDDDGVLKRESETIGETTNNEAEYVALLRGLLEARELGFEGVEAVGDSELVVKQVDGEWKCRAKNLKPLYEEIVDLAEGFDPFSIRHVPREANSEADELAAAALDGSGL